MRALEAKFTDIAVESGPGKGALLGMLGMFTGDTLGIPRGRATGVKVSDDWENGVDGNSP